jgi:5-methyltetrahydrofolate--homocysteine methyltransferase
MADTLARRVDISRARLRTAFEGSEFPAEDIIFDPNIFAIATGIEEHSNYAIDYIEATLCHPLEHCRTSKSAGVFPISFSFRGNDPIREADPSPRFCSTPSKPA